MYLKRVLITGKNSYVGINVEKWLMREPDKYYVESISVRDDSWKNFDFSKFDVVFHVAGIAHVKEKKNIRSMYYKVNRDLTIDIAKKVIEYGVSQLIFMSSMSVYGLDGKIGRKVVINRQTIPNPKTLYGKSKFEAEKELEKINSKEFKLAIVRAPMIYGPNCPGNYNKLKNVAVKSPLFPLIKNERSVLHIDKLSNQIKKIIDENNQGLFFPQDDFYVNTSLLAKELSMKNGKRLYLSKTAGILIKLIGKNNNLINKVFGNLVYDKEINEVKIMSESDEIK